MEINPERFEVNWVVFEMVYVPGGTFTMGATAEQGSDAKDNEKPTHSVTLSGYYIGKYEVTQKQWKAIMGNNPSRFKGDNLPVQCVSWDDCQEFIKKLNKLTGKNFSLPTEAQWEYAARGGKSGGTKYSGSNAIKNVAWYGSNSSSKTHPVGEKSPNDLGIYDMSGNVWEWCQDWHGDYSSYSQTNPTGPGSGELRVLRGGCYSGDARRCRVSSRIYSGPDFRYGSRGFRLCLEVRSVQQTGNTVHQAEMALQQTGHQSDPSIEKFEVNGVSFDMVYVPGGTFTMGATAEQGDDATSWEKPTHSVTLSGYYIGKYEVTQAQWKAIMGTNPSGFKGDNLPVENVSWDDCQEFIRKLNQLTGKKFSLPTEAQWEYAARGGKSGGTKYSGSDNIENVAWYWDNAGRKTHPVGTKSPNSLGIYDMTGNVMEWCQDWYGYYYSPTTNPTGPNSGSECVIRGGSWCNIAWHCRVSFRNFDIPVDRFSFVGFRLCLEERSVQQTGNTVHQAEMALQQTGHQSDPSIEKFEVNGVTFEMVYVPGGTFTMGATAEQGDDARDKEKPTHSVTLSGYYIGKYEVTQAQWMAVMGNNPSNFKGDNLPVERVSWDDCQEFIRKLNELTGKKFSLPTEAQWEYAARGGKSGGTKYSGSNTIDNVAWYWDNAGRKTHPVGTKSPNDLGIFDMTGNVWEWCEDYYGDYPSYSQINPTGPESGSGRVGRGGCWFYDARNCRVSNRHYNAPGYRDRHLGFRLCLSISE